MNDRGRVPFALVGVLLLVSSLALAPTLSRRPPQTDPAVETALDRANAELTTALRDGATAAARRAAADPVIEPANTSAGRALDANGTFRDSLRIRIYLAVRERLDGIDRRVRDVRVTASLPSTPDTGALRRAKERVTVARAGENDTALRTRIENVTVTVRRDGRVIDRRRLSPTVVVATPVLLLHDRVREYERRLDRGPQRPGLGRRLTARLYPIAWARGYAQYGGTPIENVVANRHVALLANGALIDEQRAVFGRTDPAARRTLAVATARTGAVDVLSTSSTGRRVVSALGGDTTAPPDSDSGLQPTGDTPGPTDPMRVGVNRTADAAFVAAVGQGALNRTLADAYSVDARLVATVSQRGDATPAAPPRPPGDWTLADERTTVDVTVSADADHAPPSVGDGWHVFETYSRVATVRRTRIRTWESGNATTQTTRSATDRRHVTVAVAGRHRRDDVPGTVRGVHERGHGPFDGPNLADVGPAAVDRLVGGRGGPDVLIARAATGTLDTDPVAIRGAYPAGLRAWVYRDLSRLREQLRRITVTAERGAVGTFEANPPAMLADRIERRRANLTGQRDRYESVAHRARVVARDAYVQHVIDRLEERADDRRDRGANFGDQLDDAGGSLSTLRSTVPDGAVRSARSRPPPVGPAGPVRFRVDAAPAYLTRAEVTSERVPAVNGSEHPLAVRNVNVFSVPYGDAVDTVLGDSSDDGVRLGTAAHALRAANATLERAPNGTLRSRRARLTRAVGRANRHVRRRLGTTLAREGIGRSMTDRQSLVSAALADWPTTHGTALAITNGSAAERIAAVAAERGGLSPSDRDWLRVRLRRTTRAALTESAARPTTPLVNSTARTTRTVARKLAVDAAGRATARATRRATRGAFGGVPAGLPVAPVPGYWYATANVWHVQVRGEYARFGLRARRGTPADPGASVAYARDGATVSLDVDDDGDAERLGTATRVSFETATTVLVVVPPRPTGVGDRDGNADERSAGWPAPGCRQC